MSIFRRKTSKGITKEYHYKFIQSGKTYFGVCEGCTTERQALEFEKRRREEMKKLTEVQNTKELFDLRQKELSGGQLIALTDGYDIYLTKPGRRQPGEHQKARNRTYWNDFVAFMVARYPDIQSMHDVTRNHAEKYLYYLRTEGAFIKEIVFTRTSGKKTKTSTYTSKVNQLSPRTINARHKAIKAVFTRLQQDTGMTVNPFDFYTVNEDTESREVFADNELRLIIEHYAMPFTKPIFLIGLCTGLTLGDICLLRWSSIREGWITCKRRKTKTMLDIPILPPLREYLDEQRRISGDGEFITPELAELYQRNPTGLNNKIRAFLESLGIQTAKQVEGRSRSVSVKAAHALRHTFAAIAAMNNIPLAVVQSVLGHMTPEMTKLYQDHATRKDKQRFFEALPLAFGHAALPVPGIEPERAKLAEFARTGNLAKVRACLRLAGLTI